jgi:hypothetical protein
MTTLADDWVPGLLSLLSAFVAAGFVLWMNHRHGGDR